MEKENLYLIHGEDYLRHIEEKLELFWMANVLMCYIKDRADADSYLRLAYKGVRDFDERCGELFRTLNEKRSTQNISINKIFLAHSFYNYYNLL